MKIGDKIKERRLALGLSQKQAAAMVQTYQQRWQHWESGHTQPDPNEIRKIAEAFAVSTDYLVGRDSRAQPYTKELDKEIFLLCEEVKQYGPESVKRIRKMLPLIFEAKPKKGGKS